MTRRGVERFNILKLSLITMDWPEEKFIQLIDLYHEKPLLWNPKHADYIMIEMRKTMLGNMFQLQ